jgi:hypothetical protein
MAKGRTLYDRTVDRLKNNKVVVAGLIALAVLGGLATLAGNIRDLLTTVRRDAPGPLLEYSRIVLATDQPWDAIPRDAPNYFYGQLKALAAGDAAELRALEAKRRDYVCPWMFAAGDWCTKVEGFFSQKGLQNIAIDPRFDVLVMNPSDRPLIIQGLAVEIVYAEQVTVSLGNWETTRIPVDASYEILMPPYPAAWFADQEIAELLEGPTSETPLTAGDVCRRMFAVGKECRWDLPLMARTAIRDPIYLNGHAPYRFELVLRDYHRLPNNVVVRFVVETNKGPVSSRYYYLLAM